VNANEQLPDELEVREVSEQFSSLELIEQFDEGFDDEYRFGPGDRINIEVWDRPELSGTHIIGPDGGILLPIAGSFKLAGLSRDEAVTQVSTKLSGFYIDPDVTVRVEEYSSNSILVLGRVAKPGAIQFNGTPTLLEAITLAGGLPVGGVGADEAALTRCAVFRGQDRVIWIELSKLLSGEELAFNIRLRRQDVVYIPDAADQLVFVMGEVTQAGAYNLSPDMSLCRPEGQVETQQIAYS
jgi:polysaccharide export outer membrane protein